MHTYADYKAADERQALKEILEVRDFDAFLVKSGYAEKVGGKEPQGAPDIERRSKMNIQQFARKLTEKENQSPLLEALRALRLANVEQFQGAGFDGWIPWGIEDPPARVKA